ncbi:hypothetical protein HY492_03420 [Candidatus Woesearchaeota archaeon]|nr:hypothetical protein [Candidatus Woesearchaeota archaeon]
MGWLTDDYNERKAFEEGVNEAKNEDLAGGLAHVVTDFFNGVGNMILPTKDPIEDAREEGYHAQKNGELNDSSSDSGSSSWCFLTTACIGSKGRQDDCLELETLRAFRDSYILQEVPGGHGLVRAYYKTAPRVIAAINGKARNPRSVFERLYDKDIRQALRLVEGGRDEAALFHYQKMVRRLERQWLG